MGLIQEFLARYREKKAKQQEFEGDIAIQRIVAEKQKSANERELESYMKEMREAQITARNKAIRKKKTEEFWRKNLFSDEENLFKDKVNLGGNLLGWH